MKSRFLLCVKMSRFQSHQMTLKGPTKQLVLDGMGWGAESGRPGLSILTIQLLVGTGAEEAGTWGEDTSPLLSLCAAEAPRFESIMEDVEVGPGETARFAVVVEGKPLPDIMWYKVRGECRLQQLAGSPGFVQSWEASEEKCLGRGVVRRRRWDSGD